MDQAYGAPLALRPSDLVQVDGNQQKLIPEDVLGERLVYAKGRTFHELIEKHRPDIERRFGPISSRLVARPGKFRSS